MFDSCRRNIFFRCAALAAVCSVAVAAALLDLSGQIQKGLLLGWDGDRRGELCSGYGCRMYVHGPPLRKSVFVFADVFSFLRLLVSWAQELWFCY